MPSPSGYALPMKREVAGEVCLLTNSNHSCLPLWGRGIACGGRGLTFSRFFNISVFTFETSIVGYAATFPIGESKFFLNRLKPCQYRYFIRLRRLLYVPSFEKRYSVTA